MPEVKRERTSGAGSTTARRERPNEPCGSGHTTHSTVFWLRYRFLLISRPGRGARARPTGRPARPDRAPTRPAARRQAALATATRVSIPRISSARTSRSERSSAHYAPLSGPRPAQRPGAWLASRPRRCRRLQPLQRPRRATAAPPAAAALRAAMIRPFRRPPSVRRRRGPRQ